MRRVIALDGPAASGKSSTGLAVARALGWVHLDSGSVYRALTLAALDRFGGGREPGAGSRNPMEAWSGERVVSLADELPVRVVLFGDRFVPEVAGVNVSEAIQSAPVTANVSALAAIPVVRQWVTRHVRDAVAGHPPGVVVDGRDIGTVVFPDAPLKVFLTATPDERARRRITQRGEVLTDDHVQRESQALSARDHADSTRPVSPLIPARDAETLDTTGLPFDAQVARIVALARAAFPH